MNIFERIDDLFLNNSRNKIIKELDSLSLEIDNKILAIKSIYDVSDDDVTPHYFTNFVKNKKLKLSSSNVQLIEIVVNLNDVITKIDDRFPLAALSINRNKKLEKLGI